MNEPEIPGKIRKDRSSNLDHLPRQVAEALILLGSRLVEVSETASLDASVLLAHLLNKSRAWVLTHPEAALNPQQVDELKACLVRLEKGEPLPYILGHWEFYGLEFEVTPDVLIPRPETEMLVEKALAWLQEEESRSESLVADIGTGSGCIAVALAARQPRLKILATDLSFPALQVARHNAFKQHVQEQIQFVQADLLAPFAGRPASAFNLICSNMPYVPSQVLAELPVHLYEPRLALDGGTSGLDAIQGLIGQSAACLAPGGLLLAEIESLQGAEVRELARQAFPEAQVEIVQDFSGQDRLLRVEKCNF